MIIMCGISATHSGGNERHRTNMRAFVACASYHTATHKQRSHVRVHRAIALSSIGIQSDANDVQEEESPPPRLQRAYQSSSDTAGPLTFGADGDDM